MSVVLRNYNGLYSIFVKDRSGMELVHSTHLISEANRVYDKWQDKINNK